MIEAGTRRFALSLIPLVASLLRKGRHVFDGMKRPLVGLGLPVKFSAMTGHFRSAISRKPVDGRGNPIPWYSYPAIHFLSSIIWEDCRVLEFGSGYSTL